MGISGQDKSSWQTEDLPFELVTFLIEHIAAWIRHERTHDEHDCQQQQPRQRRLKGAIDANLLGYRYIHDRSSFAPDGAVAHVARAFSEALIDMVIFCDHPTERHPSKRASCERRAKAEKAAIKLIIVRAQLQSLLNDQDVSSEHATKINDTQKKLRSLESTLKRQQLPPDFCLRLEEFVHGYSSDHKGDITIEIAPTQADPCIAKMAVDGDIDFIISGDSDFVVYVGPNGSNGMADIMLKDLKLTMRKEPIRSCKVYTGQKAAADLIETILHPKLGYSPFEAKDGHIPDYPIFSGVQDPMVRALTAMVVGCDACPGGVVSSGPKAASDLLKRHSQKSGAALHDALAEEISTMSGAIVKTKDAVSCLAKSILYEKTNSGYVHGKPAKLERYLEAFADSDTEIVHGPDIASCKGWSVEPHPFLAAEGVYPCESCQKSVCRFCFMNEADEEFLEGKRLLCFECMRGAIAGMTEGEDEDEMRAFLAEKGQCVPATATYIQVLALYEKAEAGEFDIFDDDIQKVKFPILPTSALHPSQPDFERIKEVTVHEMERLFLDVNVPINVVVDLMHILASLTRVEGRQKGKKLSYRNVLPSNIISMAANARVHTGERLCKRGLRHALDAGTPDILNAKLTLAKHGHDVCIIIAHKLLASMKTVQYAASSAITTDFLAAECNCKAGCKNNGPSNLGEHRLICTHSMTEPVQLSQLMFRGMAMNVLVDFRRRVRRENIDTLGNAHQKVQIRDTICRLIKATGQCPPVLPANATILEMLENYAETTGRAKLSPGEPNVRDLGLLRDKIVYRSPEVKAEKIIKHENETVVDNGVANSTIPHTPKGTAATEEYEKVGVAEDGISFLFSKDKFEKLCAKVTVAEPIGFKLRHYRGTRDTQWQAHDYSKHHQSRMEAANMLRFLLNVRTRQRGWAKSPLSMTMSATNVSRKHAASTPSRQTEGPLTKKKRSTLHCCICGVGNANAKLQRVPNYPPALSEKATVQKKKTHRIKSFKHREWMDRLGFGRSYEKKDLRICDEHPLEKVTGKNVGLNIDGKIVNIVVPKFDAPVQVGIKSFGIPPETLSNGTGTDREMLRHAIKISEQEANLSQPTRVALAREGLVCNNENSPDPKSVGSGHDTKLAAWKMPHIMLEALTPDEVKRRTGFQDLKHLLRYSAVVCGGNLDYMAKTVTKITWLEELVLYYELSYGRTKIRMKDYEKEYSCCYRVLMKAIQYRLSKELECRERWPMYASYEEDAMFRDPSWNRHFDPKNGHRVVMHDTTNIPLPDPSSGDLNRALHNKYYNMCCGKAGVALQLCCWIFGLPLVTGHSDEDRQIEDTNILEQQKEFSDKDPTSNRPFLNILDKGYNQHLETQKHGQMCCQPDRADKTFGGDNVLRTGCVAVARSGNERAVKRCKISWFIKRGCCDQLWDIGLLCDVWEAFTFRVNFMYDQFQ